jgi:Ca2+-binding RTX toxin-like protein
MADQVWLTSHGVVGTLFGNFGSDVISGGPGDDFIDGDNPLPPPPGGPPFPPGGNNDTCSGGPGDNVLQNCEAAA